MRRSKGIMATILALWVVFYLFYYYILNLVPYYYRTNVLTIQYRTIFTKLYNDFFNETGEFLLSTPGCTIPNYERTMVYKPPKVYFSNCQRRGIFLKLLSEDELEFTIEEGIINHYRNGTGPYSCCYKFVTRPNSNESGINDTEVRFSSCINFEHGTKTKRLQEVICVICTTVHKPHIFYRDAYIMLKKVRKRQIGKSPEKWNVLILGMDTMSRVRIRHSMPRTTQFFKNNSWLDYKAYHKIGDNTYPNLMAMLAGDAKLNSKQQSMDAVNDLIMWSRYKRAGYVTAYGEDNLKVSDTFKYYGGFEVPPTDHYMRPFYLLGEYTAGNKVCSARMSSAVHLLDYAHQFSKAYENDSYFGFFWINSYSHNPINNPQLFDNHISTFLSEITKEDKNNNTFIIFMSDHGIRFGESRFSIESYYEERLPMLYIWVPRKFRLQFPYEYYNLQVNQNRLVTPYDLHATLWDILKKSNDTVTVIESTVCPHCTSLFYEKSQYRTCSEAAINEKWCSCHQFVPLNKKIPEAKNVITTAFYAVKKISSNVETKECTKCVRTGLKTILRIHKYKNNENNKTHYVVAFLTTPGDSGYEVIVDKGEMGYKVNSLVSTITAYNTKGTCVINRTHREFCMCNDIRGCQKSTVRPIL